MELPKLNIIYLSIDSVIPNPRNSRTHSEKQLTKLTNSVKRFGFNEAIAINKDNVIIAGHARLEAAKRAGFKEVPTIQLGHLTREEQKAYLIFHNKIALEAGWDDEILKEDFLELTELGFDLELTGFEKDEIESYTNVDDKTIGLSDPDSIPEFTAEYIPICKPGDLWILGKHRLVCGDSTMVNIVDLAVADNKPILMVTDPPYGVNYNPEWRDEAELGVGERSRGKVENDNKVDWTDSYSLFTGDVAYIWHAGIHSASVASHIINCDFEIVSQIIWVKQHFALSRGDYHWQHEPCWYAVRKGQKTQLARIKKSIDYLGYKK